MENSIRRKAAGLTKKLFYKAVNFIRRRHFGPGEVLVMEINGRKVGSIKHGMIKM